ncbi:bifunctional DNA primase/polymerase [uncultured Microbacterium sp.]|uniref:bifunctional DNA primase/polymerase n=1 Tax=uncultured Microbacterium sp. TaxID=191216 RepID=UPI0025E19C60|nr:bifunctional DNA primase/polymerase [uncultured Microbacterium sp.]
MPDLNDALALARNGWAVIPLRGKVPVTAHGVKDATTNPDTIGRWWARGALHNVGARVPAALVVLDIDPQNGGTLDTLTEAAGGYLPDTLTVHSGRGIGGRHLYFLHPGGVLTSTRLPAGIDVKTERGYCVMPPSLHPATGRPYLWEQHTPAHLPAVLLALLRPEVARPVRPSLTTAQTPLASRAAHLARHVAAAAEGNRNARLYWAACQAIRDGHAADVFTMLERAAVSAGLPEAEARRTIASARRGVAS